MVVAEFDFPRLHAFAIITSKHAIDNPTKRYHPFSRHCRPGNCKSDATTDLAIHRPLALKIAKVHPDKMTSMRGKFKPAGWDEAFWFDMLANMR